MTDDDTKFERARREAPHIEAFARAVPSSPSDMRPEHHGMPVDWAEMLARWSAVDQLAEGSRQPPPDTTSSH